MMDKNKNINNDNDKYFWQIIIVLLDNKFSDIDQLYDLCQTLGDDNNFENKQQLLHWLYLGEKRGIVASFFDDNQIQKFAVRGDMALVNPSNIKFDKFINPMAYGCCGACSDMARNYQFQFF